MSFKVGDRVIKARGGSCCTAEYQKEYTVYKSSDGSLRIGGDDNNGCECQTDWELINQSNTNIMTNIKDKVALIFKKEPEKSYIKAGIMGSDEQFTDEGQQIFLSFLATDPEISKRFIDAIIKPLIEEDKKSK